MQRAESSVPQLPLLARPPWTAELTGSAWDPRARLADDAVMDRVDVQVSCGIHVSPEHTVAALRSELRHKGAAHR